MLRMVQNYLFQFALHHVIYTVFPYTTLFRRLVRVVGGDPGTELGQSVLDLLFAQQDVVDVGMGVRLWHAVLLRGWGVGCTRRDSRIPAAPHEQRSEEHTSELQSRGHLVCR